jgi:hypothetical protein
MRSLDEAAVGIAAAGYAENASAVVIGDSAVNMPVGNTFSILSAGRNSRDRRPYSVDTTRPRIKISRFLGHVDSLARFAE